MRRRKDTFGQILVGTFMVVVLVLLGYFTIVISGVDMMMGRERRLIRIAFPQVGGLKEHDNVMYRGTKVGTVDRVEVSTSNLVVTALVDQGVVLRRGYQVTVCNLSMLGGNYLSLEEGEGEPIDLSVEVLSGEPPTDWMKDLTRVARNLNEITSHPEIREAITNFSAVSQRAKAVAAKLEMFLDKAHAIADNVNEVAARVNQDKDQIVDDVKSAVSDIRAGAAELRPMIAAFRKTAEGIDIRETVAKADQLLLNLNAAAEKLKNGEGTLGRLNNDPRLYQEIDGLIRDVRQVIDNYRDTTPISTFSSLAAGAF